MLGWEGRWGRRKLIATVVVESMNCKSSSGRIMYRQISMNLH